MNNSVILSILVPTFNRSSELKKNIDLLGELISRSKLIGHIQLVFCDNSSTDNSWQVIKEAKNQYGDSCDIYRSETNKGLEANTVTALSMAKGRYVMFLGDDDFLPDGYLDFIADKISSNQSVVIIPGFSALYKSGEIRKARHGKAVEEESGFKSVFLLSSYGHQLSGIVMKRSGLLEGYLNMPQLRNIYLFIGFLSLSLRNDYAIYEPKYQVLVTQGNSKDWKYDKSGLLVEVLKNYQLLYKTTDWKYALCCIRFVWKQPWRLGIGLNPFHSFKSLLHFSISQSPLSARFSILICYPLFYVKAILAFLIKKVKNFLNYVR